MSKNGATLPKVSTAKQSTTAAATTNKSAVSTTKADASKKAGGTVLATKQNPNAKSSSTGTTLPKIGVPADNKPAATLLVTDPPDTVVVVPTTVPEPTGISSTDTAVSATCASVIPTDSSTSIVPTAVAEVAATIPVVTDPATLDEKVPVKINGNVILLYEMYNEFFPIENGSTTAANIDDVYCLSFVMPNCLIHLSRHPPAEKRRMEEAGESLTQFFVYEEPRGTYQGLVADTSYYVYVEQEADQLKRDQQLMRERAAAMDDAGKKTEGRAEGCSCLYGNPCVDQYICKDWDNRFATATKNGWKGF